MTKAHQAATPYSASNPRMARMTLHNKVDELWTVNIRAFTPGEAAECSEVMFVESNSRFIFGIDHEDGLPRASKRSRLSENSFSSTS
jgi:hypothetical protein